MENSRCVSPVAQLTILIPCRLIVRATWSSFLSNFFAWNIFLIFTVYIWLVNLAIASNFYDPDTETEFHKREKKVLSSATLNFSDTDEMKVKYLDWNQYHEQLDLISANYVAISKLLLIYLSKYSDLKFICKYSSFNMKENEMFCMLYIGLKGKWWIYHNESLIFYFKFWPLPEHFQFNIWFGQGEVLFIGPWPWDRAWQ